MASLPDDPVLGWQPRLLRSDEVRLALPLIIAVSAKPEPLEALYAELCDWLSHELEVRPVRGIMTLRNTGGVISALFFFRLDGENQPSPVLVVPRLRILEATGRRTALEATLRTVVLLGETLACAEVRLPAEWTSPAWLEVAPGLSEIGHHYGFCPSGTDWVRPIQGPLG